MRNLLVRGALGLALLGGMGAVSAQTLSFGNPTPAGTTVGTAANAVTVVVSYTGGNGVIAVAADVVIPAEFTSVTSSSARCTVNQPDAGRIRLAAVENDEAELASIANFCTLTFNVANTVVAGNYNFSICSAGNGNCQAAVGRNIANNPVPQFQVTFGNAFAVTAAPVVTGPTIVAGSPAFSSNTNVPGGTLGGAAVTQNISFGASTGGALGGTTNLVCTDDDANTTLSASATQNGITNGQTPTTIVASFTPGAARTVNVNCTATRQGTTDQTFSYAFAVGAGGVASGPVLTPPGATTLTVGGNAVGQQGTGSIVFTAANGDAGQSTPLNCSVTSGTVTIVSGGTQNVNTGSQPAPVVVGVTLTNAAQPNVGVVTCNGVAFTISAPAGSTFVPPEVIPASSLWSQLSLIALFAALGGLVLVLRRNG